MLTRIVSCWESPTQRIRPALASTEADRPVRKVVELAAARIGLCKADVNCVIDSMESNGLYWAWQLMHCNASHWAQYGASHGLETAIRHELQNPTDTASGAESEIFQAGPTAEKLRQFLLIPGPDGLEPKPLGDPNAPLMTLLTVPRSDRQKLVVMLCELLALVAGLLLSVPLQLMQLHSQKISSSWTSLPSTDDWFHVCLTILFLCQVLCIMGTCFTAVFVSASGFKGSLQWYGAVIGVLGMVFNLAIFGALLPVVPVVIWHMFDVASSPYPMIGVSLLSYLIANRLVTAIWTFHIEAMALEIYHLPSSMRAFIACILVPNLRAQLTTQYTHTRARTHTRTHAHTHTCTHSHRALRPLARQRAGVLRAHMGVGCRPDELAFTVREGSATQDEAGSESWSTSKK